MNRRPGIYSITHIATGRQYIGSAKCLAERRWSHIGRLTTEQHHCRPLQNAWKKYGADAFTFAVIEFVEDMGQLLEREQHYLDTLKPHYNVCRIAGSCLGTKWTEERRAKQKAYLAANPRIHSPETRAKISASQKGRVITAEEREKISRALTGRERSPEHRANIAKVHMGMKATLETRQKLSESHKGIKQSAEMIEKRLKSTQETYARNLQEKGYTRKHSYGHTGKTHSEETRAKIAAAKRGVKQSPETIAKRVEAIRRTKEAKKAAAQLLSG